MHLWPSPRKPPCHPATPAHRACCGLLSPLSPHNFIFLVAPQARLPRRLRTRFPLDLNRPIVSQLLLVVVDFLLSCCSNLPICVDCSCFAQTFLHVLEMAYSSRAMQQQAGVAVFVVLAAALILGVAAQNSPSTACDQYETPLANCLDFLSNTAQTPSTSCCSAISQVQKESVTCLCSIVSNIGSSVPINVTRAKEIPQDCNLSFTNTVCEAATGAVEPAAPTSANKAAPSPSSGSSKPSQPGAASTITPSWLANLVAGAMALVAVRAFVHAP